MGAISDDIRTGVTRRAGGRCEYCHVPSTGQVAWFAVDHITPQSRGGATDLQNLALACPRCNAFKWAFTDGEDPVSRTVVPLFHPRLQKWSEHFAWSRTTPGEIEGRTPTGRATIQRLRMNDAEAVRIRWLLSELGLLPLES